MKRPPTRMGASTRVPSQARASAPSGVSDFEPYFRGFNVLTDPEFENFRDNSGGWYWPDRIDDTGVSTFTIPYLDVDCPSFLLWPDQTCAENLLVGWAQTSGPYILEEPPDPPPPPPPIEPPPDEEPPPSEGDTIPPAVPTGLEAFAGDTQVIVDWNDNTEADFASYRLYRATSASGPFVFVISPPSSNHVDTGLVNGTTYWYAVSATDTSGNESSLSTAAPPGGITPTTPPGGDVTAPPVPTGLAVVQEGNTFISLDWNNSSASDFASFNVKRATVSGGPYTTIASRTASDYTNSGLTNGTTYYYVVSALDTSNNQSANSAQVDGTPVVTSVFYGPRVAVGPKSISQPGGSITINVGDTWQTASNNNAEGVTFWIKAGTHVRQSVLAKDGQKFVGELGAIMDGQGVTKYAFDSTGGGQSNIGIKNLDIKGYIPDLQTGVLGHWGNGDNWLVEDCVVHDNGVAAAIRLNPGMKVFRCYLHHNGQYGFAGGGGSGILIEDCEVSFNNTAGYDMADQGGSKFWNTQGLVMRYSYFHHNFGTAVWADIDNIDVLWEHNRSSDNDNHGFFQEIGYECIMRFNIAERNLGSGFRNVNSRGVEIHDNECINNSDGISSAIDTGRPGPGRHGLWETKDQWIHDNYVEMGSLADTGDFTDGHASCMHDPSGVAYGTARNNNWNLNTYHTTTSRALSFHWNNTNMTFSQWQAAGRDGNGQVI